MSGWKNIPFILLPMNRRRKIRWQWRWKQFGHSLQDRMLQQENICEYLEKGVYTIDMFTKRDPALTQEIKQLQISEAELLRHQTEGDQKDPLTSQIVPVTQQILESYSVLTPLEKNQLWKLVMKKATVYRSQDDGSTVRVYPDLPK